MGSEEEAASSAKQLLREHLELPASSEQLLDSTGQFNSLRSISNRTTLFKPPPPPALVQPPGARLTSLKAKSERTMVIGGLVLTSTL